MSHSAGLVTLLRGPIAGNAAYREQDQRSARWPTLHKARPVCGTGYGTAPGQNTPAGPGVPYAPPAEEFRTRAFYGTRPIGQRMQWSRPKGHLEGMGP